ncbi:response regulator [Desulfopila sp. IMCC35006]|uniref:chemotaxis protein CheB n=1 Tax=Desulfopila sp. IMCC35006 TaxID=2569542 RepID=UPI0010AC2B55|nr:chemotaxis protein CheB [Desulfopila sp. IMCC35006]TKB27587.1 response regulator [Desulfopila sp. IMCC35006]
MQQENEKNSSSKISLLIVDDSLVFRKFLEDIFNDCEELDIVGEAQNGIEALDLVLKKNPDVILLDMEMPLMDGMTALQHLMIHRPTPTIMFSSLTETGTARCFDTLKNGAVDFVCKDFIFQKSSQQTYKKLIIDKVKRAAAVRLKAKEPVFTAPGAAGSAPEAEQRVVFCEECGNGEVITVVRSQPVDTIICSECGDIIELRSSPASQDQLNNCISVFGGGEGCFFNLLQIVPQLADSLHGALIAVIHQTPEHVNSFAEYLDAISEIKVIRAREGVTIESGNCYLASGSDYMNIKPYNGQLTLQKVPKASLNGGPVDILLASVSTVLKKRAAGIILSGDDNDGDKGMALLLKNGGMHAVLREEECYHKNMGRQVVEKCSLAGTVSMEKLVELIKGIHTTAQDDSSDAGAVE